MTPTFLLFCRKNRFRGKRCDSVTNEDNKLHPHAVTTVQKRRKRFCSSPPKPWKPCNKTGNNVEKHTMRLQREVAQIKPTWKIFKSVWGEGRGGKAG